MFEGKKRLQSVPPVLMNKGIWNKQALKNPVVKGIKVDKKHCDVYLASIEKKIPCFAPYLTEGGRG